MHLPDTPTLAPELNVLPATPAKAATPGSGAEELRLSEERFRQVFEAAPDGLVMVDGNGKMVLANSGMERMFGYARAELIGQAIEMLMPVRYRDVHPALRSSYMVAPTNRIMAGRRELYARRKDGVEFPAEISLNALQTSDGPHALATIFDITMRRANQALIEKSLQDKTALLNEVHHRVKNNLQIISSLLSLQSRNASDEARAVLAESQSRVKAMALIHQLLYERSDFSRINLGTYLGRLCSLLRETFSAYCAQVSLVVTDSEPGILLGLQHAVPCGLLVNELITNAIKHAFPENRGGKITVLLENLPDGRGRIVITDDGIGIPENVEFGGGRSLGFQLIPLLADQLGGQIQMHNENGARFEITFTPEKEDTP